MLAADDFIVCRIEAVPAGSRNVYLCPGVRGAVLTFADLDVARDKSRRKAPMPGRFHHEHREVAARAAGACERLVGQLDARLLAMGIFLRRVDLSVQFVETDRSVMRPLMRNAKRVSFSASMRPVKATVSPISRFTTVTVRTGRASGAGASGSGRQAVNAAAVTNAATKTSAECKLRVPRLAQM